MKVFALLSLGALAVSAAVRVPVAFEPNRGQWGAGPEFLAHAAGYTVSLRGGAAEFLFRGARVSARLAGARAARPSTEQPLPFTSTYLVGPSSRWRRDIPAFGAVRYAGIYPGIDVRYYGAAGSVEYDFEVAAGADPGRIRLDIAGARRVSLDEGGDLLIETTAGTLRQRRPVAYQETGGARRDVAVRYVLSGNRVSLRLGEWDRRRALVIDPALTWAGYTGTAQNTMYDDAQSVAVDATGNVYVAGTTLSGAGDDDIFVVKMDPNGNVLNRVSIGGEANDDGYGVAVDSTGAVYVVGSSDSVYWQISTTYASLGTDAFYAKIDPTFSNFVYAGFYGGGSTDVAFSCKVDAAGNLYFGGQTASTNLPLTRGAPQMTQAGGWDGFIVKMDPSGSLLFGTYLGGSGDDYVYSVAADATGNIFAAGHTGSTNLAATSAALQQSAQGGVDAFVAKYAAAGSLSWLTYLGGSGDDEATSIAVDASGAVVVVGGTASTNFPTAAPYQPASAGGARDMFVSRISPDGSKLLWSTYLGGSGDDLANSVGLDAAGNVYIAGSTASTNFPNSSAWQTSNKGGTDGTVSELSADGSQLVFSSYLGGAATDYVNSLALNCTAGLVVAGSSQSTNFPSTLGSAPALSYSQGAAIGFVAKVAAGTASPTIATGGIVNAATSSASPVSPGSLVSIYGTSLAGAIGGAASTPLPNSLNGVSVTVNGATVPLLYVSPGQINFQLPFETAPGTASATVTSGCGPSVAVSFPVAAAAPYLLLGAGGDALVQNQDYSFNSPSNPAPKGSIVTVYLIGIGPLDKPVATGAATPVDYFNATLPSHALIGGFDTNIKFLGMTPNFVGLTQANLEVPNLSPGKYPVVITVNGVDSNAATMYVK